MRKSMIWFFFIYSNQISFGQQVEANNTRFERTRIKDMKYFIGFCQNKFDPKKYFELDSICITCIKKDFKKYKLTKIEKSDESSVIHLEKRYGKRLSYAFIYLTLNRYKKDSATISFNLHPTNNNNTDFYVKKELGMPIGSNQDSSSIYWEIKDKGLMELWLNGRDLTFYTQGYQELYWNLEEHDFKKIPIVDKVIIDSLPKLPVRSNLLTELNSNDYFYEDNIFSNPEEKVFGINFFQFCQPEFDALTNEFVIHKRDINQYSSSIDSLKNECFKKANLYRGSSINIYDYSKNQDRRVNQLGFSVACFKRGGDTDDSNKRDRIKNTLNFLIVNSKTEMSLLNVNKFLTDFIDNADINAEQTFQVMKDNYSIQIYYNKIWLTVFINMPRSYFKN